MNRIEQLIEELCPDGVEYKELGEVYEFKYGMGNTIPTFGGKYPVYGSNGIVGTHNEYNSEDAPVIGHIGAYAGIVNWGYGKHFVTYNGVICKIKSNMVIPKYAYYHLLQQDFISMAHSGSQPFISYGILNKVNIPIPPLPIQQEIVTILDTFTALDGSLQAELEARRKQYEHYRNQLLNFEGKEVEWKTLGEIANFSNGKGHEKEIVEKGKYIVVNSKFVSTAGKVVKYANNQICPLFKDDILIVMSDLPNGKALAKCFYVTKDNTYTLNQRIGRLSAKNKSEISPKYLFYILNRNQQLLKYDNGTDQTNLRKDDILDIQIPIPPLSEQERIVGILDKFDALVSSTGSATGGLPAEIDARRKQYEYYREKLLTFEPK